MTRLKNIHLSVIGSAEEIHQRLSQVKTTLERVLRGEAQIPATETTFQLKLSSLQEYDAKRRELQGEKLPYQIAQFASDHNSQDSIMIVENIARHFPLNHTPGKIIIPGREEEIVYGANGRTSSGDVLQVLSCHLHQDMAAVIHNDTGMIYTFDSSLFEKTPKNVHTGENYFLGRDLLEFHGKGKNFGSSLPNFFGTIFQAFATGALDMLSVDLQGSHLYSDGSVIVRRFERDYALPLIETQTGKLRGMIAYADVFFQEVNEKKSPFDGGSFLQKNYAEFTEQFQVMKNGA